VGFLGEIARYAADGRAIVFLGDYFDSYDGGPRSKDGRTKLVAAGKTRFDR
jgi:hypothetical protein